ncbi:hypothetical protein [Nocardia camponoti]|uniref:hypothetical protein n=1 Tax=Nocardia camponoti TaxID=1616106 RepID=UPI001665B37F|nr:hypothetical protein [Nocardia camponoti]
MQRLYGYSHFPLVVGEFLIQDSPLSSNAFDFAPHVGIDNPLLFAHVALSLSDPIPAAWQCRRTYWLVLRVGRRRARRLSIRNNRGYVTI